MGTTRDTNRYGAEVSKAPAAMVGEEMQSATLTLAGTPEAVTFKGLGLEDMADTAYRVMFQGEFAGSTGDAVYVDESSIAATGFSFVGGAASEVVHFFIHGKIANRKRY